MQAKLEEDFDTPVIEQGVMGPRNEAGLLLRAPRHEALVWDLESEVGSARRVWMHERNGWWIAASYLETVIVLVLRSFPSVFLLSPEEDRLLSRDGVSARQERLL